MTPERFDALFDTFHATVTRLETLPAYAVADYEGEQLDAYLAGRPRPLRTVATSAWLARIARTTMAGKTWSRVRIVDEPLTTYQRYELTAFLESQVVGEQISVARRGEVFDEGPDFWLFDEDTPPARAVLMRYDESGHWLGAELVEDTETIADCTRRLVAARAASTSLNEFVAMLGG